MNDDSSRTALGMRVVLITLGVFVACGVLAAIIALVYVLGIPAALVGNSLRPSLTLKLENRTGGPLSDLRIEDYERTISRKLPLVDAGATQYWKGRLPSSSGEGALYLVDPARQEAFALVSYYEGELRGMIEVVVEETEGKRERFVRVKASTNMLGYEDGSEGTTITPFPYAQE